MTSIAEAYFTAIMMTAAISCMCSVILLFERQRTTQSTLASKAGGTTYVALFLSDFRQVPSIGQQAALMAYYLSVIAYAATRVSAFRGILDWESPLAMKLTMFPLVMFAPVVCLFAVIRCLQIRSKEAAD